MSRDVCNEETFKLVWFVMYYCFSAVSSLFSVLFCQCFHFILVLKYQLVDHILQIDGNLELAIKWLLKEQDTYLFKQGTENLISQYVCFSAITRTMCKTGMSCSVTSCTLEIQWITLSCVYFFLIVSDCVAYSSSFPPSFLLSLLPFFPSFLPFISPYVLPSPHLPPYNLACKFFFLSFRIVVFCHSRSVNKQRLATF